MKQECQDSKDKQDQWAVGKCDFAVPAWTGFQWSGVTGTMRFAAREGKWFWSNGHAWGTCEQRETGKGIEVTLHVLYGSLTLQRLEVKGVGAFAVRKAVTIRGGESVSWHS